MCELCHTEYRKKWKDWAVSHKILNKGPAQTRVSDTVYGVVKMIMILYVSLWFVLMCVMMSEGEIGVNYKRMSVRTRLAMYSTFILIILCYAFTCISFFSSSGFNNRIELRVQSMFPRSNNADYANDLNLPIKNKIAT